MRNSRLRDINIDQLALSLCGNESSRGMILHLTLDRTSAHARFINK